MPDFSFDAVIFDLDGVITATALVHSTAWKQMFDEFLNLHSERSGTTFREFTHHGDYLPFVDGKPRYRGIASFLQSRHIKIPYGNPDDETSQYTICGLGNRKNEIFNDLIDKGNLVVYESTINFIRELLENNLRVGVASSSENCQKILQAAGLERLFETRVDGLVSAELGLKGKPEADIFTTACDNLGVHYDRAIIVEDAVSGVQAGKNGQFGLVLGIAREDNRKELLRNGADIVINDMAEIDLEKIENWFKSGLQDDQWRLTYIDYNPKEEATRESLCAVGNGYFVTRGAFEETEANGINYPGTYVAGLYNRLESEVAGKKIINEDIVNCPNWLPLTFKIEDGEWLDLNKVKIIDFKRWLDFRDGTFYRESIVKDGQGNETLIRVKRIVSMADAHLAGLQYSITPLNYSKKITIKSGLNGQIINAGVDRYKQLKSKHWQPLNAGGEDNISFIVLQTNQSGIIIAEAAKLFISIKKKQLEPEIKLKQKQGAVYSTFDIEIGKDQSLTIDKIVSIYTSKDCRNPRKEALEALSKISGYSGLYKESRTAWSDLWKNIDIRITGARQTQKLLRLHIYHTLITASAHNAFIDTGIPARGLHGEAYRGHIFWDEMFILPIYFMNLPETAKSVLLYRYRRLDKARASAKECGYNGAMFPWQSGSDGQEETQVLHLNPMSVKWGPDHSSLQRHVSLAIAYNIWQYFNFTADLKFLEDYGAEMFLEICRFWASKAQFNKKTKRFDIDRIMGPDEYHEVYPNSKEGGLKNNSYTNIMIIWVFNRAPDILNLLEGSKVQNLFKKIGLKQDELSLWEKISTDLSIPISEDGVLEQFDGYFKLKEFDWKKYKAKYGKINRLDRILKAEGKNPDDYKVAKQADVLMSFYNLEEDEVKNIIGQTGYTPQENLLYKNFDYYFKRTSHGSTLSKLVHSYLAGLAGHDNLSYQLYSDALISDFQDVQGGSVKEGIHTGVMGGSVFLALKSYAGFKIKDNKIHLNPKLPATWKEMYFTLKFREYRYYFEITPQKIRTRTEKRNQMDDSLFINLQEIKLKGNSWQVVELDQRENK